MCVTDALQHLFCLAPNALILLEFTSNQIVMLTFSGMIFSEHRPERDGGVVSCRCLGFVGFLGCVCAGVTSFCVAVLSPFLNLWTDHNKHFICNSLAYSCGSFEEGALILVFTDEGMKSERLV